MRHVSILLKKKKLLFTWKLFLQEKTSKIAVPDTIIPEEYHLVKTKAVLGLEYIDEKTSTLAKDPEHTLRVFPSLKPNKRFEVSWDQD